MPASLHGMKSSPFAPIAILLLLTASCFAWIGMNRHHTGIGFYPEIADFDAKPDKINAGDTVTLSWDARGAASVYIEAVRESDGAVVGELQRGLPIVGSLKVQPQANTIWRMRCETGFSSAACSPAETKVTVMNTPRVVVPVSGGF